LGLEGDRQTPLLFADEAQRCFARGKGRPIDLDDQEDFCLSGRCRACRRWVEPPASKPVTSVAREIASVPAVQASPAGGEEPAEALSVWRVLLWTVVGAMLVIGLIAYGAFAFNIPLSLQPALPVGAKPTPAPSTMAPDTPLPAADAATASPTPAATPTLLAFARVAATPAPLAGGSNLALSPAAGAAGWVVSSEERGNHFGDSNLYSGVYNGAVYHGALQFDLAAIPRGAPIYTVTLQLAGLSRERLGQGGAWEVRILTDTLDYQWSAVTYQDLHNAPVLQSLAPALAGTDLDGRKLNRFEFNREQIGLLEERVLQEGKLSLRVDGPLTGANNLFSWDTGFGPTSAGLKPALILSIGAPPATPPPREYVVITVTPTPENVLTAAAAVARATVEATTTGTPTPTPPNLVTATPAEWLVITATPPPDNTATAQYLAAEATAEALTTGTPTPTSENVVTATPTPTYVIVTSVPTPLNAETAVARAAMDSERAALEGTPTPMPPNWVTPVVVVNTPLPENRATANAIQALAYVDALTGTPTPTPPNLFTATPTPTYLIVTSMPTPGNMATALARLQTAQAELASRGFPTSLPPNWVTPVVVTATPPPGNPDTATAQALQATAIALTGTPTPTPANLWTATPTPLIMADAATNPTITPVPTATPTADPGFVPPELIGKIAFVSDREDSKEAYYVMDPDGSNVQKLSGPEAHRAAEARDTLDPTGQFQVFANQTHGGKEGKDTQIDVLRLSDGADMYIAGGEAGADYDPAYCEVDPRYVVYTSQQTGNDEIFVVDLASASEPGVPLRTTRLTETNWEWNKHPSFSPDCRQIVFMSNRSGHDQIWVMDFLGMGYASQNARNISNNAYNDTDPVWIKPAPGR